MGQFSDTIRRFQVTSLLKAEAIRKDIIESLFGDIIFDSAVDSGQFTSNWKTSQDRPDFSWSKWGDGRRNRTSGERESNRAAATAVAFAGVLEGVGDGLGKDTSTFLANSTQDENGDAYGWKIEYGYQFYAWNPKTGRGPPSENVLASGFSRWAPRGMVRVNIGRIGEIVRNSVKKLT